MPAACSAARSFAASSSAPGVSPCTQIVSACSGMVEPSIATTVPSLAICTARATTVVDVMDDRAELVARDERTVGLVGAIGEHFCGDAKPAALSRLQRVRSRRSEQNQRSAERGDRARDGAREGDVTRGHVVERAVRLDVLQLDALDVRDASNGGNLVQHEIFDFVRGHLHLPASEARKVGKTRMRADGDAVRLRAPDGRAKDAGIACVKSRRDVGGGDGLHQRRGRGRSRTRRTIRRRPR